MLKRLIFDIILFVIIFWAPWWWLSFISVIIFIFIFPRFWEAVILGFLMDLLYGPSNLYFLGSFRNWIFTLSFLAVFLAVDKFKKHLSFMNFYE